MRNTVVDDNEFLFTKRIDTFSRNLLHDFPTKIRKENFETNSWSFSPGYCPRNIQKIYKDILPGGGLCRTEGSIERFAQRFSNFTEEEGMQDSSFAID